jgi:hypothetical protein
MGTRLERRNQFALRWEERTVLDRFRNRLTYANVMATVAVFIALGGTGYAAIHLPRNSVGRSQLRTHAVSNSKLAIGAVTASRVRPNALTGAQINEGSLGTVPSASAAGVASNAANADRLNGVSAADLRVRCPGGTIAYAGACFETGQRAATDWGSAALACAGAGRRLPTVDELAAFGQITGVSFGGSEWSSGLIATSGSGTVITFDSQGLPTQSDGQIPPHPYRCVAPLRN